MMMNEIPNHKLVRRTILMGEQAYIERDTGLLFVPLVEEVWINRKNGKFIRILANWKHRYNAKSPYFVNNFYKVKVFTWSLLFSADPDTMIIREPSAAKYEIG